MVALSRAGIASIEDEWHRFAWELETILHLMHAQLLLSCFGNFYGVLHLY
jgi:hypothetical protein